MAGEALLVYDSGRGFGELEDLRSIAASVDVRLARSVAVFARDTVVPVHKRHLGMRIGGELVYDILMAGLAGLSPRVARRVGGNCALRWRNLLFLLGSGIYFPGHPQAGQQHGN